MEIAMDDDDGDLIHEEALPDGREANRSPEEVLEEMSDFLIANPNKRPTGAVLPFAPLVNNPGRLCREVVGIVNKSPRRERVI
eukprot:scaffold110285_cov52-Prasinocladus_malaysianus.AAC.1